MKLPSKRRALAIAAAMLGVLALLLLSAGWWFEPAVRSALVRLVDVRSQGQYQLSVEDVDINVLAGRITAHGVALQADSSRVGSAAAALTGGVVVNGTVERIDLTGVAWWRLVATTNLRADSFIVEGPQLRVVSFGESPPADTVTLQIKQPPPETTVATSPQNYALELNGVRITDAYLDWGYTRDTAAAALEVTDLDLSVSQVRLDSFTVGGSPADAFRDFRLHVGAYRHELPDSLHVITLHAATFASEGGRLTIDSLRVTPADAGFSFRQNHPSATLALDLVADAVFLDGFDLAQFLRNRRYRARRLSVEGCTATAFVSTRGEEEVAEAVPPNSTTGLDLEVDTLDLRHIQVSYRSYAPATRLDLTDADLLLSEVRTRPGPGEVPFAVEAATLEFRDFLHQTDAESAALRIASGKLDYRTRSVELQNFRFAPNDEAAHIASSRATLGIDAATVALTGVDLDRLFWRRELAAQRVAVSKLELRATTNLARGDGPAEKPEVLLQTLQALPLPLELDEVEVSGRVAYRRIDVAGTDVTLGFEAINASLAHVGTTAAYARRHPRAIVAIASRFQNLLPLSLSIDWPNARGTPYKLRGSIGGVAMPLLNDVTIPLANLRLEEGTLRGIDFDFTATSNSGVGRLTADYEGLKVELLDADALRDDKDVLSLFANLVAVRKNGDRRKGIISAQRKPTQGMFAHWWALLQSGLYDVMLTDAGRKGLEVGNK